MLYSVELRSRCFLNCDAKVRPFFESAKNKTDFFQKNFVFSSEVCSSVDFWSDYCSMNRLLNMYQPMEMPMLAEHGVELLWVR